MTDVSKKFNLLDPTRSEIDFLNGPQGKDLESLSRDIQNNQATALHLRKFLSLAQNFAHQTAVRSYGGYSFDYIKEEAGVLTDEAYVLGSQITLNSTLGEGRSRKQFDVTNYRFDSCGGSIIKRPIPITWGLPHINERKNERREKTTNPKSEDYSKLVGMGLSMIRILEEESEVFDWDRYDKFPILLPAPSGAYLGWVEESNNAPYNRIKHVIERNSDDLLFSNYDWSPVLSLHVNTFFGPQQLSMGQKQLVQKLNRLLLKDEGNAFLAELDLYSFTVSDEHRIDQIISDEDYLSVNFELENIMSSPIWQQNVRMPKKISNLRHGY